MVTIKFQTKIQHLYPVLAEGVGISEEKLNDLKRLLRYLSPEAQDFYENLFKIKRAFITSFNFYVY